MLRIDSMSSSVGDIQVFYSIDGNDFTEECSVRSTARQDKGAIYIPLNQTVTDLRIDLGSYAGEAYRLHDIIINPHSIQYMRGSLSNVSWIRIILYTIAALTCALAVQDFKGFCGFVFRYRWGIGAGIIVICTLCKLHGSSIGSLIEWISAEDTSRLWGVSRDIRTDEFSVFTEMALSQVQSGFKRFSDIWGYSTSDMFVVYGQPILNLVTLYRPFSAGYILLGAEFGLAFYWSSRLVLLALVSFEMGRILTKDNRKLAVAYAALITFAPVVQWWYSINELVEMLISGQGALVLLHSYIRQQRVRTKAFIMLGLVLCAGGYCMTLYPAWMIPFAYVFLGCLIAMLIENRNLIQVKREDIVIWALGGLIFLGSMGYIFYTSYDTIQAVRSTTYPGSRVYQGGPLEMLVEIFRGWSSWLWGFISIGNPCEEVGFISLAPFGFLLSVIVLARDKQKDAWLIVLNIINALLFLYLVFDMPEIVAQITLLGYASQRMVNAIELVNLMLLFRSMRYVREKSGYSKLFILLAPIIGALSFYPSEDFLTPSLKLLVVGGVLFFAWSLVYSKETAFVSGAIVISLIGGGLVNPIDSGLSSLYDAPIVQAIEEINEEEEGNWAVLCSWFPLNNLPTVVGAKTVNALRTYPDEAFWRELGLELEEDTWNRYAYISMELSEEPYLELVYVDYVKIGITAEQLRTLDVKYVLAYSTLDVSPYEGELEQVASWGSFTIYKLI